MAISVWNGGSSEVRHAIASRKFMILWVMGTILGGTPGIGNVENQSPQDEVPVLKRRKQVDTYLVPSLVDTRCKIKHKETLNLEAKLLSRHLADSMHLP